MFESILSIRQSKIQTANWRPCEVTTETAAAVQDSIHQPLQCSELQKAEPVHQAIQES